MICCLMGSRFTTSSRRLGGGGGREEGVRGWGKGVRGSDDFRFVCDQAPEDKSFTSNSLTTRFFDDILFFFVIRHRRIKVLRLEDKSVEAPEDKSFFPAPSLQGR